MNGFKAVLFDLDDTLLDRNQAVDKLFSILLETCYEDVEHSVANDMLRKFKKYDKRSYGDFNKARVLEAFFNEYSPKHKLPPNRFQDFWNHHFPQCFSINQETKNIVHTIKHHAKVAIITNGSIHRQKAKIMNANLHSCFDIVVISEEAGFSKPDKRIFELTLNKLGVQPEEALFVGDDLEKDIGGCQNANMKGVWFNPHKIMNDTDIKPYAEIDTLNRLLSSFP
ncbi:HAD family hydrolase [Rossellomorea sp. NS-SX7]|uniref:HAD family hydrolase n=1 Tax=Rossellomorea sp. NS-SX7 TaxID=3463856 RepID=UPI004057FA66